MDNIFNETHAPIGGERVDTLLSHHNLAIERIVSGADMQPVDYVQPQDEWVMLLQGGAVMDIAGERTVLVPGDHLFLPAGTPHRVESCDPGTLWLAVHLYPDS